MILSIKLFEVNKGSPISNIIFLYKNICAKMKAIAAQIVTENKVEEYSRNNVFFVQILYR